MDDRKGVTLFLLYCGTAQERKTMGEKPVLNAAIYIMPQSFEACIRNTYRLEPLPLCCTFGEMNMCLCEVMEKTLKQNIAHINPFVSSPGRRCRAVGAAFRDVERRLQADNPR